MARNRKSKGDAQRADPAREKDRAMERKQESGEPGGGQGRRDVVGRTGVYPESASERPSSDAPVRDERSWGQGQRGVAGYEDSGSSELTSSDEIARRIERDRQREDRRSRENREDSGDQRSK